MTRTRGAVLYETAVVLPLVLLLTLSAIRFGLAGYAQMQADGAAFTSARYAALGIPSPIAQTQTLYPGTNGYNYPTPVANPAPTASAPIDWAQQVQCEYSNSLLCTGGYESNLSYFNRHGGSSVLVAMLETTKVRTTDSNGNGFFAVLEGGLTKLLGISSTSIEPYYQECGKLYLYGLFSNQCVMGATSAQVIDWTTKTTPPYYMSTTYLAYCALPVPSLITSGGPYTAFSTNWQSWSTCSLPALTAIGGGAELNLHNYYRTTPGANGMGVTTGSGAFPVFRELACHQRVFARLASILQPSGSTLPSTFLQTNQYMMINLDAGLEASSLMAGQSGIIQTIYGWDRQISASQAATGGAGIYPDQYASDETAPLAGCGSTVYAWDSTATAAANPTVTFAP
jgi:hypothetical protein